MSVLAFDQILQLFLILQTLIFSLILFSLKNIKANSNKVLALYMFITLLQFILNAFELFQYYKAAMIGYYLIIPLILCNAPILYLYVKILTIPDFKINWKFIYHLIPAIIIFLFNVYFYGNITYETKMNVLSKTYAGINTNDIFYLNIYTKVYQYTSNYFYNIQVLFYSVLMILRLRMHRRNISSYFSYTENISLNWLRVFILAFLIISFYEVIFYNYTSDIYLVILNVYFLFLGFFGIKQNDIYIGKLRFSEAQSIKSSFIDEYIHNNHSMFVTEEFSENNSNKELPKSSESQENKIRISVEQIKELNNKLIYVMENEKPYLDSTLNLPDLAEMIGVNRNILSLVINETYNKNFFNYINEHRIKEAQSRLLDPSFDNLSIEGLAKGVGFNSKSVFNPAFKIHTGKTPVEYKKARSSNDIIN